MPIVDAEGRLSGIISQADVATRMNHDKQPANWSKPSPNRARPSLSEPITGLRSGSFCLPLRCRIYSLAHGSRASAIHHRATGLVDVLDRVLDKGLVIAGDIKVSLAEVELLTIRIRLLICSLDKAQEIGLDWWRYDRDLSPGAQRARPGRETKSCARRSSSSSARSTR